MSIITSIDNIYKKGVIGNVRTAQEDSHDMKLKTPNGDLFVVCDGMGGHVGGAKASSLAVESIVSYMDKDKYADPIQSLNEALQFANIQILGFASEHPEYKGMGTTACIVLMQDNDVWIAHVGDSRIYLYLGKEKELHRITKDHSFVQTLVDAGEITDDEAEHHPNKNRILKALGIKPELQPSFNRLNQPIHPKNGDIFLICSDGLSGMIPDTTIEKVLSNDEMTLEQKGDMLIDLAMQGETVRPGGQDNCTVELIQIDNSPWKKREFFSYNPAGRPTKQGGVTLQKSSEANRDVFNVRNMIIACLALLLLVGGGIGLSRWLKKEDVKEPVAVVADTKDSCSDENAVKDNEKDSEEGGVVNPDWNNYDVKGDNKTTRTQPKETKYEIVIEVKDDKGKKLTENDEVSIGQKLIVSVNEAKSDCQWRFDEANYDADKKKQKSLTIEVKDNTDGVLTISYGPEDKNKRQKISLKLKKDEAKPKKNNPNPNGVKGTEVGESKQDPKKGENEDAGVRPVETQPVQVTPDNEGKNNVSANISSKSGSGEDLQKKFNGLIGSFNKLGGNGKIKVKNVYDKAGLKWNKAINPKPSDLTAEFNSATEAVKASIVSAMESVKSSK